MGTRLLLTSTLLYSWTMVGVQPLFAIRNITLTIEPGTDLIRDTNATVRCKATVSTDGEQALSRTYNITKDGILVYTKTTSSSEDLLYQLPDVRVSSSGKYKCSIEIKGRKMDSKTRILTVTGLSKPSLQLYKQEFNEGEDVTATCLAPGETGSIIFYFYIDSKEIFENQGNANQVEAKLPISDTGNHTIHCDYTVLIRGQFVKSQESNGVKVSIKKLFITPILNISPQEIFEGDRLSISCTIDGFHSNPESINLYLSRGTRLLSNGKSKVNHTMVVLAKDSGEFECRLEMGKVVKTSTLTVHVIKLFSEPRLSVRPTEVFQGESMTLTCRSDHYAPERLRREEITYTFQSAGTRLAVGGVLTTRALLHNYNYTCTAQAKGIQKQSEPLLVRPKVSVGQPKIAVVGKVILGKPFQVQCQSDRGSLPINYTLWKNYDEWNTTTVRLPYQQALFTVTINRTEEIIKFMCEAQNNPNKDGELSKRLNTTVIVPLSEPTLTVLPDLRDIVEGNNLYLICGIKGTPPVTFKWYRSGISQPLSTVKADQVSSDYQLPGISSEHSGTYYCEAVNHANNTVRSQPVTIEVRMALWKKGVIVVTCLLVLTVLVLLCVLRFRSRRDKKVVAAGLSVKPSSSKSDDSLTVSLGPGTAVYTAATVTVDRTTSNMWSERPTYAAGDEESSVTSHEKDVEYTEVLHPQPVDPARVPLKGTDTVYSELQNAPHGLISAADHEYGSLQYAELNAEPVVSHTSQDTNHHQDLPVPVD